jgi:F-type H+-transporting ATPase subunit delta
MAHFRGASADAVAALGESLSGDVAGSSAGTVADDLFSVAATLRGEGALRRFLTDGAVPSEARTGLVGELFDGKVDAATAGLLRSAVGRRWTSAGDLPQALEHLGVNAVVSSAGADAGRLSDELFAVAQAVKDSPELRDALSDPVRSVDDKSALVDRLLAGRALPATLTLVKQALTGTHRTVNAALADYQKVAADAHGQGVATVRVAKDLTDAEQHRLADALQRQYGRPVHLNVLVDPDVLGGIRVEIGDDVIDGTVSSRLEDARRLMAG